MRVAQLEAELTNQPFDAAGNQKAVQQISVAVEQTLGDLGAEAESCTTLLEAECRLTLCRIELSDDNEQTLESFLYEFTQYLLTGRQVLTSTRSLMQTGA